MAYFTIRNRNTLLDTHDTNIMKRFKSTNFTGILTI